LLIGVFFFVCFCFVLEDQRMGQQQLQQRVQTEAVPQPQQTKQMIQDVVAREHVFLDRR
jgi:hypothetical protein